MKEIINDVYHVGDSGCSVFLVDTKSDDGLVLIDCGMDLRIIKNISNFSLDPMDIKHCILTHFHIDHIAACFDLKQYNNAVKFYAHELDADAIEEKGHNDKTAASWYGVNYKPIKLEKRLKLDKEILKFGGIEFQCIHTPGHTPGSISVFIEIEGMKILFGQDIHGPFMASFGSNLNDYQMSMKKLLDLEAQILCEGHFGVIKPAKEVERYIKNYMAQNRP
ncbi:MAG: MBL fold metallo-hydrolase [Candidatus Hodarchaeota archaeon]